MTKTLLCVLAHPDDESFGTGGTLARYAMEGVDVHIAIATDGAAGSVAEGYEEQRSELAAVREQELRRAVEILGGTLHLLGFRDSGYINDPNNKHPDAFINQDLATSVATVADLIRKVKPDVVYTHDSTGGYWHPDHIRCYEITTPAFAQVQAEGHAWGPKKLYYTAFPNTRTKLFIAILKLRGKDPTQMGRNKDIDLTKIGLDPKLIGTKINIRVGWDKKRLASAEHGSQGGGGLAGYFPKFLRKRLFGYEQFIRAYPAWTYGDPKETDLFEGL